MRITKSAILMLTILAMIFGVSSTTLAGMSEPGQYKQWDDLTWLGHSTTLTVSWDSFPSGAPDNYTTTLKESINQWFASDSIGSMYTVDYVDSGGDIHFTWKTGAEEEWGSTNWNNMNPQIWIDLTQNGPTSGWISSSALHNLSLHEFGHGLALDHPDSPAGKFEPIMSGLAWTYNDIKDTSYDLTSGDKTGTILVNTPLPPSLILVFPGLITFFVIRRLTGEYDYEKAS